MNGIIWGAMVQANSVSVQAEFITTLAPRITLSMATAKPPADLGSLTRRAMCVRGHSAATTTVVKAGPIRRAEARVSVAAARVALVVGADPAVAADAGDNSIHDSLHS